MKNEKIIIVGHSGSGKDFLLKGLVKLGLKYSPKITTRPKRQLEQEGLEYNFIDNDTFIPLLENNKIKVYQCIRVESTNWYYAITHDNFEQNQLFILTPYEISLLKEEDRKRCFVVYLDINEDIRRNRISSRNDNNDSVERRIQSDKVDFNGFNSYDLKITDPDFEVNMIYDLMNY